jgi:hypothetical protein
MMRDVTAQQPQPADAQYNTSTISRRIIFTLFFREQPTSIYITFLHTENTFLVDLTIP